MKIEKISENQIRCTLSKEDLMDRELRISELAYGTEKAKALFRDMMQQASYELGFEAEDIPLMIEAIPVSTESLVLIITKVEDPDELDTRFSKFSPDSETEETIVEENAPSFADELLNCFGQINQMLEEVTPEETNNNSDNFIPLPQVLGTDTTPEKEISKTKDFSHDLIKIYSFKTLDEFIHLAKQISCAYSGINHLYKNEKESLYYFVISKSSHTPEEFNKVCNIISEYGRVERTTYASTAYYEEHFDIIVKENAVQMLAVI